MYKRHFVFGDTRTTACGRDWIGVETTRLIPQLTCKQCMKSLGIKTIKFSASFANVEVAIRTEDSVTHVPVKEMSFKMDHSLEVQDGVLLPMPPPAQFDVLVEDGFEVQLVLKGD